MHATLVGLFLSFGCVCVAVSASAEFRLGYFAEIQVQELLKMDFLGFVMAYVALQAAFADRSQQTFPWVLSRRVVIVARLLAILAFLILVVGTLEQHGQLSLTRTEYDPQTWDRLKINDRFEFPLELDMSKHLSQCA